MLQEAAFLIFYALSASLYSPASLSFHSLSIRLSQAQSDFSHSHSPPASLVLSCRLISGSSVIGLLANWPAGCQTQQRPSRLGHSGDCPPPLSKVSHQLPLSALTAFVKRLLKQSRCAHTHTCTHLFPYLVPIHPLTAHNWPICPLTHCL